MQAPSLLELQKLIESELKSIGLEESEWRAETELIIRELSGLSLAQRLKDPDALTDLNTLEQAKLLLARRKAHEPLQYILGKTEFFGLQFSICRGVLIPRADTETLVEAAAAYLKELDKKQNIRMGEIGIGSGIISLSLLNCFPSLTASACDISQAAVDLSFANASMHKLESRLELTMADWQEWLDKEFGIAPATKSDSRSHFDLLVSNPPYIPKAENEELAAEVRLWEPEQALYGGDEDGLSFYRQLAKHKLLQKKLVARVILEIGYGQLSAVKDIFQTSNWQVVTQKKDLSGIDRVIVLIPPDCPF